MRELFHKTNPYDGFPVDDYSLDLGGWSETDTPLREIVRRVKPSRAAEVGVWKGRSLFWICDEALQYDPCFKMLAVDTWTGAPEFWNLNDASRYGEMRLEFGHPTVYRQFIANVIRMGRTDTVIPFPVPSNVAAMVCRSKGLTLDLVHIDGSHDYESVCQDIDGWRKVSRWMCGHDYDVPAVRRAVRERFGGGIETFKKWWFVPC